MPRDHFAQMYKTKSTRHDEPHDSIGFDEAIGNLTGMLYSIVTLRAFFPFFKSPAEITDSTVTHAPYPMPSKISGDPKKQYTQLTLW
jgi:hypothetical protein